MQPPTETVSTDEWAAIERAMAAAETPAKKARPNLAPESVTVSAEEMRAVEMAMAQAAARSRPLSSPAPATPMASTHHPNRQNLVQGGAPPPSPVTLQFTPSKAQQQPPPPPKRMMHQSPINLSMYDRHRFMITNYPTLLGDFLKSFPGAVQGNIMGIDSFHFPFKHYAAFLAAVRERNYERINEIPQKVVMALCNPVVPEAPFAVNRLPPDLWETMFPFQRQGVEFVVNHNGRAGIFDEMGLGKTIQAIAFAAYYEDEWPLLIVCPSSLRVAWSQSIERFLPHAARSINIVLNGKGSVSYPINIISFDLASKLKDAIAAQRFRMCIVDESHYLKSLQAKRTQALLPVLLKARRVVLLSGTPALSRPKELFSQLHVLNQKLFPNFGLFANRYCAPRQVPWGMDYSGASNTKELNSVLGLMMIRRKKDQVLDQLPAKTRQKVLLYVEPKVLKSLEKLKKERGTANEAMHAFETRQELRDANFVNQSIFFELFRNTGRAKLPAVIEYLLDKLGDVEDEGPKFIVFAHHQDVMDGICSALDKHKFKFIRIDGKTSGTSRQPLVDVFQTDPTVRVAVLSITAAGVGLTLTAAQFVLFAELFYNPGAIMQAEDRAHRIGQRNNVQVHYLVARQTVDEHLFRLLNRKISVLGETLDGVSGSKLRVDMADENKESASEKLKQISEDAFLQDLSHLIAGRELPEEDPSAGPANCTENKDPTPPKDVEEVLQTVRSAAVNPLDKFAKFQFGSK